MTKINRNDPCPCGSGKKYKQCCISHEAPQATRMQPVNVQIPLALRTAIAHHDAGQLHQAEVIYRQILQVAPNHPDALHLLGLIAHQAGKHEIAVELIGKAIGINPVIPLYYSNLGSAFMALGKLDKAVESYRKALSCKPDYAEVHYNLGNVLRAQGRLDEAAESLRKALSHKPGYTEAYNNLGNILWKQGKLDEAVENFRKALVLKPNYAEAHNNLGAVLLAQDKLDEAAKSCRRALALTPDYADAHNNLGSVLLAQNRLDESAESFRKALSHDSGYAEAHYNLGNVLQNQHKPDEAIESYRKALSCKPDYAEAYNSLGETLLLNALKDQGNPDELDAALENFRRALSHNPSLAEAYFNIGNTLQNQGKLDEVDESYRKALLFKPDYEGAYNNRLFFNGYHALLDPKAYLALAQGWELSCVPEEDRQAARSRIFRRLPFSGQRLKVGYVSGDLRQHSINYFLEKIFAHHDRSKIELFAYSNHVIRDAVTERLQALVEHWIPVAEIPDAVLRERIETDNIDVLIDLSGYTGSNRLGVFARRAAPVQAHYLGFFASTGLTEMDYWIGDEVLTPPETDSHFSEQVWRLPRVWVSYEGKPDAPLPAWQPAHNGTVWLGSFNNLGKLTPATLALWAKVLHALPEGKLLLKTKELADAGNRRRILDGMANHGIAPDRIELQDRSATPDWPTHMAYYDRLDIALDPVGGVGGGTTTCDALWMGVPVITHEGDRMASRMTASMLDAIGHPEWIVRSEAEYIDKVVALTHDVEQRKALRSIQRSQMAHSQLCDAKSLVLSLENAYFEMFKVWLEKQ